MPQSHRTVRHSHVAIALSFSLLAACQQLPGLKTLAADSAPGGSPQAQLTAVHKTSRMIRGRAIFPARQATVQAAARQVQATAAQVTDNATVALIDTGTGNTLAAGQTDASGNFTLAPNTSFVPTSGGFYYLEVTRRANSAIGGADLSMLTLLEWTASGWASVTNPAGGSGEIVVNPTTTAVVLTQNNDSASTTFADIIGTVTGAPGYTGFVSSPDAFTTHTDTAVSSEATVVTNQLGQDTDPVGTLLETSARMAPDDTGSVTQWHVYPHGVGGVTSDFVWVPVFTAYQLINPANCGSDSSDPAGYWVASPPSSGALAPTGTANGDYASETFGGFYVAQFEASHADAAPGTPGTGAGATAGSSSTLKVAQYCVPWVNETWDQASQACMLYDGNAHLMGDDDWTALAVWSMTRGITVYGNNAETSSTATYTNDHDIDNTAVIFTPDLTYNWSSCTVGSTGGCYTRALTGSGADSAWASGVNDTTNTGTPAGVYDLNGNVWEWTDTIELGTPVSANGDYAVDDTDTGIAAPATSYVNTLSTDPRLRRYGVAGSTSGTPAALFGNDYFWTNTSQIDKPLRGGSWNNGAHDGVWALYALLRALLRGHACRFPPGSEVLRPCYLIICSSPPIGGDRLEIFRYNPANPFD